MGSKEENLRLWDVSEKIEIIVRHSNKISIYQTTIITIFITKPIQRTVNKAKITEFLTSIYRPTTVHYRNPKATILIITTWILTLSTKGRTKVSWLKKVIVLATNGVEKNVTWN